MSANANQDKADIKARINWAGGTDTATGLGDDNIQSIAASGGGLTRATKLKVGTAKAIIVNSSTTGAMSELVAGNNKVVYTDGTGVLVAANSLPLSLGGTGSALTIGTEGDVLTVVSGVIAFASSSSPGSKIFNFYQFS